MTTIEHPILGSVECVRSLRARSIRLRVRVDGTIRVTYPLFASRREAMAFVNKRCDWVVKTRERLKSNSAHYPTITALEQQQLRREAQRVLRPLVAELAHAHGFEYTSLRISSAHTRWGSCSGKNGISLSLFVMLLPDHLRRFVILHELCHTRHHNHSAAFHSLLDSCVEGKEKLLNRELRSYRIPRVEPL